MNEDATDTKMVADKVADEEIIVVVEEDVKYCALENSVTVGPMDGVHTVAPSARKKSTVILTDLQNKIHKTAVPKTVTG